MNICLLSESGRHAVLDEVVRRLAERHSVTVRNPAATAAPAATARRNGATSALTGAQCYLLKSRSVEALRIARAAERGGALVINRPGPTARCLDRMVSAARLANGAVPAPRTWTFESLGTMAAAGHLHPDLAWPLVVKSRHSRRGDLVRLVQEPEDLLRLLPQWRAEPVIAQAFAANDGLDVKVWVIDGQLSAARRPCALQGRDTSRDVPLETGDLPAEWVRTVQRAGAVLGLELFGVDLVISRGRPMVVDVNAFPGFRSADRAAASIAAFVERLVEARRACA